MTRTVTEVFTALTAPGAPFALATEDTAAGQVPVFATAPASLRDVIVGAGGHGVATALVCGTRRWSYTDLVHAASALAADWVADGLRPGDRVAIIGANDDRWVVSFWAVHLAGAVVVPLNSWHPGRDLVAAMADAGARIAVCDGSRYERIAPLIGDLPELRRVLVWDPTGPVDGLARPWPGADRLLAGDAAPPEVLPGPLDPAAMLSTSGTSGRPKLAVGNHRAHVTQLMNTALYYAAAAELSRDAGVAPATPVALLAFPLFHIAGLINLYAACATGGTVVLLPRWDAQQALELIQSERVTASAMVPTMLRQLLAAARDGGYDVSSLATLPSGGAPLPPDLVLALEATFDGRVASANGYGLTEICGSATSIGGIEHREHPASIGRPLPTVLVRIVDPDGGNEVADGEIGELRIGGVILADGYHRRPEETAATFRDGWLRTGDLGYREPGTGLLYVVDRIKDVIVRGGENIYCAAVEAVLVGYPGVDEAALVGVPDEKYGEIAVAFLTVPDEVGFDAAALLAHAGEQLASFQLPAQLLVQREALPKNAAGKVLKAQLREQWAREQTIPGTSPGSGGS
ncbi:MAG TPA: AMP-binding protein [Mycobacteriales bacterium]|nr:AMP-binding protein [Mycobacteriales bacterium]